MIKFKQTECPITGKKLLDATLEIKMQAIMTDSDNIDVVKHARKQLEYEIIYQMYSTLKQTDVFKDRVNNLKGAMMYYLGQEKESLIDEMLESNL